MSQLITIKDKLWNGSLNVRVILPPIGGSSSPQEYLLNVYRNSYFPEYFRQLIAYFQESVPGISEHTIWLEYDGVPVKWNLPIGTLYDYLHLTSRLTNDSSNVWTLSLRYTDYPSDYIIPFNYKNGSDVDYLKSLEEVLINQLKQSCYVTNGSSKMIMNLSGSDTTDLLDAIHTHNLPKFEKINNRLVLQAKFRKVPVKIYIPGTDRVIQAPILPQNTDGDQFTLGDILREQLPDLFDSAHARPYVHGVDATSLIHAPIVDVWKVFKHLDNFLYIVVILN